MGLCSVLCRSQFGRFKLAMLVKEWRGADCDAMRNTAQVLGASEYVIDDLPLDSTTASDSGESWPSI
jgi:hypothetical protein